MIDKNEQEKDRELLHYLKKEMQNIQNLTSTETIETLINNVSTLQSNLPTKTSDLTNDSGFITASSIPSVPSKTSDLVNDSGFITASSIPSVPSKTSQLVNDSGFLTSHQNISGKEDSSNKTSTISASPNNTKYPTEKAVADYVANCLENIPQEETNISTETSLSVSSTHQTVPTSKAVVDYVFSSLENIGAGGQEDNYAINMKLNEIQNQLIALGGTILFTNPEIANGTRLTSVASISALNSQFDTRLFNTFVCEKIPFSSKGSNGPTAIVFFRQAPFVQLTPTIDLKFFLRDIPSGSALPVNVSLNGNSVFSGNLSVLSGQDFQARLTLSNLSASAFNKLQIAFNSSTLANVQLDYLEISISNTQNCIILNRDDTFSISGFKNSAGNISTVSTLHKENIQNYGIVKNPTTTELLNPATTTKLLDNDNNTFHSTFGCLHYDKLTGVSNFIALTTYTGMGLVFSISNNTNKLWLTNPSTVFLKNNVFQASVSIRNGEQDYSGSDGSTIQTSAFIFGVDYNHNLFLMHALNTSKNFSLTLNNENLPAEFIEAVAIQDLFCRIRTTYVENVGYFAVHKTGIILYFPKVHNAYCIKVGKGKQLNAYLSEDGLSINLYYEFNEKIYKKVLTRQQILADSNWTLSSTTEEFANIKEFKEWIDNTHLVKDNNFVWSLENN